MRHVVRRTGSTLIVACLALLPGAALPTLAAAGNGGASASDDGDVAPPRITSLRCEDGTRFACETGQKLTVIGAELRGVRSVVFLGGPGVADDRGARPVRAKGARAARNTTGRVTVEVPEGAKPGPVRVLAKASEGTVRSKVSRPLALSPAEPEPRPKTAPVAAETAFPIQGKHTYGAAAPNLFGGRHQGQDVFAECGTPLVAGAAGRVRFSSFQSAAGNYVVIDLPDGTSHAYMHLQRAALVDEGDQVEAGTPLGAVGDTGRATGCHLHFETWTAPGWYKGGKPVDPKPLLKSWDRASSGETPEPTAARAAL